MGCSVRSGASADGRLGDRPGKRRRTALFAPPPGTTGAASAAGVSASALAARTELLGTWSSLARITPSPGWPSGA